MFHVERSLWQGCVLVSLYFNIFFTAAVLRLAEKRSVTDAVV